MQFTNNKINFIDRVFGLEKLRVIDGSVFPSPISGFPNSIIIAVAERASELILKS